MSLALYGHPFSSFSQKALVALYENAVPFELRQLGPDPPEHEALYFRPYFPLAALDRD
jgi:glutathione S-transferase